MRVDESAQTADSSCSPQSGVEAVCGDKAFKVPRKAKTALGLGSCGVHPPRLSKHAQVQ